MSIEIRKTIIITVNNYKKSINFKTYNDYNTEPTELPTGFRSCTSPRIPTDL